MEPDAYERAGRMAGLVLWAILKPIGTAFLAYVGIKIGIHFLGPLW